MEIKISSFFVRALKNTQVGGHCLTSETVQGLSLTLEGVDDIHGGDGLSAGVFGVGDGITDDVLQEHLQDTTSFFVDQTRDTLDTTTTSQTADGGLGNTLDVIAKDLSVTLGASLSESFSSFSSSRHDEIYKFLFCFFLFREIVIPVVNRTVKVVKLATCCV